MKRIIDHFLFQWKIAPERKVLLVRGARQVGKTYSVRKLAKKFEHFLEVNFEEEPQIKAFFELSLNPKNINEKLAAYYGVPVIEGKTLIFFDEIQACPQALRALRFYHEKTPHLHVIAAGSLLEFALSEIPSFGVGRISNLFLYPLCFKEFLWAIELGELSEMILKANPLYPMDSVLHQQLVDKFRIFQILGGMPAVVQTYIKENDLRKCQIILDELLTTFRDDFAKYRERIPQIKLRRTFESIAHQLGGKFKYSNVSPENSSQGYKDALDLLIKAGLAYKIYHTSARGLPLGSQTNIKKFKVILFDLGICQRLLGLDIASHMLDQPIDLINKGNLSEAFVGLELVAHHAPHVEPQLFYWHREARASNAEVDYVIQKGEKIVPIEVKAGTKGQMQSLFIFLKERGLPFGIRISHENFGMYDQIITFPIYSVEKLMTDEFIC
jgi:predicted AAA+ superfamily ATPase